jgi:PAS domain S-box-containing protein
MVGAGRATTALKAALVAAWLLAVAAAVHVPLVQDPEYRSLAAASLAFPILMAALFFGRLGGLAAALAASAVWGAQVVANPAEIATFHGRMVLAAILFFNVLALVVGAFAQRESRAKELYRGLFQGMPVGLYRSSVSGRILEANQAMARILGYADPRALLAVDAAALYVHPEERRRWLDLLLAQGEVRDHETLLRRADGTTVWVQNTGRTVRSATGAVEYLEGVVVDVDEVKAVREDLQATTSRLEKIIEFLPDACFVVDSEKRVIAWNRAVE